MEFGGKGSTGRAPAGQPEITINKIADKVELMCGLERKSRTDPKGLRAQSRWTVRTRRTPRPRGLRYIFRRQQLSFAHPLGRLRKPDGRGCRRRRPWRWRTTVQGGANITITQVPFDRLFWDPHSRRLDFSDARVTRRIVLWMDKEQAYETWRSRPAGRPDLRHVPRHADRQLLHRPAARDRVWCDSKRERVRIVQMHWQEKNEWWVATLTASVSWPSR